MCFFGSVFLYFRDTEAATGLLGVEETPTIHISDVVLAKVVWKLKSVMDTTQPGSVLYELSLLLMEDIRRLHKEDLSYFHASGVFAQVDTLFTPSYRGMAQMTRVEPYGYTEEASILYIFCILCALNPYVLRVMEESKEEDVENYVKGKRVNQLLLVDIVDPAVQVASV